MKYSRRKAKLPDRVAEPVQVYLDSADRDRLDRLKERLGASKSDVLRRALAALDSMTQTPAPRGRRGQLPTFAGKGLRPGVSLDNNAALLDLMEGRDAPG